MEIELEVDDVLDQALTELTKGDESLREQVVLDAIREKLDHDLP